MKNGVLFKLRLMILILRIRLKSFWIQVTMPFFVVKVFVERYLLLLKIDREYEGWDRHIKLSEIRQNDEMKAHKSEFLSVKVRSICALLETGSLACRYISAQKDSEDKKQEILMQIDDYRENFKTNKVKLIDLVEKLESFKEINFDSKVKQEIVDWKFEDYNTEQEIFDKQTRIVQYITQLNIA